MSRAPELQPVSSFYQHKMTSLIHGDLPDDQEIATFVSQNPHLRYLSTASKDLSQIAEAIQVRKSSIYNWSMFSRGPQASKKDNHAVNALVQEALSVIFLLTTWAAKASKPTIAPELDEGVKELLS